MDSALGVFRKVTKFVGQMGLVGIALALTILQSQCSSLERERYPNPHSATIETNADDLATPSICLKWPYISIWRALPPPGG